MLVQSMQTLGVRRHLNIDCEASHTRVILFIIKDYQGLI